MIKLPLDTKKKFWKWGPIDGRPFFPNAWYQGMLKNIKDHPPGWPSNIIYFKGGKIFFAADYDDLFDHGEKTFRKYVLGDRIFESIYKEWLVIIEKLENLINNIYSQTLKNLDNKNLYSLFNEFNNVYCREFWNIGLIPELANFGGETILSRELKKKIKNEKDFHLALEKLSAPENFSFYQNEELDLLALKFIKDKRELKEKLIKHQQKYFWLFNSYHHAQILPVIYFEKMLKKYSAKSANEKIKDIKNFKQRSIKQKEEIIKKFNLPVDLLKISKRLAFCIWWQDLRKAYIFQSISIMDMLLREAAKRFNILADDLYFYIPEELGKLFRQGNIIPKKEIEKRKKHFFGIFDYLKKNISYVSGKEAELLAVPFMENKISKNISQFKGMVVNRGKIVGKVKIIFSPREINKMKKGDILVAPMTSPNYILALKKAVAVITDEGGLTCHAAIVSRELKIPGIVGTKIATQVLHDGDLVEVDAEKGTVKIIKRLNDKD